MQKKKKIRKKKEGTDVEGRLESILRAGIKDLNKPKKHVRWLLKGTDLKYTCCMVSS